MKLLYFLLCLMISSLTFSQNCEICNEALRKDIYTYSTNNYITAKYAEDITENEYNEMKKDFHHNGKVPIPWLGGIVEGSFDYNDFKKIIHDYVLKAESETTSSFKTDYTSISTNPMAYPAWEKCMENCNLSNGIHIYRTEDGENFGQYKLRYVPAPRESDSIFCRITINTQDSTIIQDAIIYKNGTATYTYPRKFTNNVSETIISVNASQTYNGGVSYSDKLKSKYIKPAGIKVSALTYSYVIVVSKNEIGQSITNCELPIVEHVDRHSSLVGNGMINRNSNLYTISNTTGCQGGELGRSCDNKWSGYYHIIQITPSEGYSFRNPLTYNQLRLDGPMAGWNWNQRCSQNDKVLIDKPDIKQFKLWLHQNVTAHLEMTSYKDSVVHETVFANVDDFGKISFEIPNSKLNNYSIEIRLSDESLININPSNVNDIAYLNVSGDNTLFTLKNFPRQ